MDSVNKFFLIAVGLIVTGALVLLGFRMANIGKDTGGDVINRFIEFSTELQEVEIMQYDGATVSGSDVINFIRKNLSEYPAGSTVPFTIVVKTGTVTTHKDNSAIANIMNFSHVSYINPTAKFKGKVVRNTNGVIVSVTFTQI